MIPSTTPTIETPEILPHLTKLYKSTFANESRQPLKMSIFKGGLYLTAINAGLPYVKPAMQFTSNKILSKFLGASVYIAIGSVSVWSVRNFMSYLELIQNTSNENKCSEIIISASSLTLGILSALPGALITLKYNPIWMLPLSVFFDISTNTASLNQFFRKIYIDRFLYHGKQDVFIKRNQLINRLQYGINNHGVTIELDDQLIIHELNQAIAIANPKLIIKNNQQYLPKQYVDFIINFLGLMLPLPWEIICIHLVYNDALNLLKLNCYLAGIIAIATTFPAFFLEYLFAVSSLTSLYDLITDKSSGVDNPNPAFKSYPQTTITLLTLALFLVSGAFTSRAQIILDLLRQSALRDALLYLVCIGTIIFKMSAAITNVLDLVNDALALCSSDRVYTRRILFNKYQTVLETANPATVRSLLLRLSPLEEQETDLEINNEVSVSRVPSPARNHWCCFYNRRREANPMIGDNVTYSALGNHSSQL